MCSALVMDMVVVPPPTLTRLSLSLPASSLCEHPSCLLFRGIKVTKELQDNGTGVLRQVAQQPIDQVY